MNVRVLYHDHCFDGAASAAFVSRFLGSKFYPGAQFCYTGLAHKADQLFEDSLFDGAVNATGFVSEEAGAGLRTAQTGRVQNYAAVLFGALVIIGAALVAFT